MDPKNIARVLGKLGHERGRANERLVLEACLLPQRPAWMKSARAGTRAEDHEGIDVVVESDVGKLFVQVKSSRTGKAAFAERRRRAHVAVEARAPPAGSSRPHAVRVCAPRRIR